MRGQIGSQRQQGCLETSLSFCARLSGSGSQEALTAVSSNLGPAIPIHCAPNEPALSEVAETDCTRP